MTVAAGDSRVTQVGPGTNFVYNQVTYEEDFSDVYVEIYDSSTGTAYVPTLNGAGTYDFTCTGTYNDTQKRYPSGVTVVLNNALPNSNWSISVECRPPIKQASEYDNGGRNDRFRMEADFDRIVSMVKVLDQALADTIRLRIGSSLSDVEVPEPLAGGVWAWNAAANALESKTIASLDSSLDFVATNPQTGQAVVYNGSSWVNGQIDSDGLEDDAVATAKIADDAVATAKIADGAVTPAKIDSTVNDIGDFGGGTQDINLNLGRTIEVTISTSAATLTISNPLPTGNADAFDLWITNGGSQTINWPASITWLTDDGNAPVLTSSGTDWLVFNGRTGGTTWYGSVVRLDV